MSTDLLKLAEYAEMLNWTSSVPDEIFDVNLQINEKITSSNPDLNSLNWTYTIFELLVALVAVIGNAMVIIVFKRERKLRRRTNYYIISLAIADFLVGLLGIPFAILASVGLPRNLHACLFTISILVVCCTISIFCLVAVSVDRYWAILHPMAYSRNVRTKTAIVIISLCWVAGIIVGFLPLFGWHQPQPINSACLFVEVMSYDYLVFLYFGTIITPTIILIAFYAHIYHVIVKQLRRIVTMNPSGGTPLANTTPTTNVVTGFVNQLSRRSSSRRSIANGPQTNAITPNTTNSSSQANSPSNVNPSRNQSPFCCTRNQRSETGGTMLRVLGAAQKREVKATQNLSIIVLFFMICWIPLYTMNCVKAFCNTCDVDPIVTFIFIILSHLNSAVNPILYAYHLRDFRAALKNLLLKMIGREVPRNQDLQRQSIASQQQHRLQSMIEKRSSLQPRIYIDSPVWLRQQQHHPSLSNQSSVKTIFNGNAMTMSCNLGNALRAVAKVATSPTDSNREMSKIIEVPSNAERESSRILNDNSNSQLSYKTNRMSSQGSNLGKFDQNSRHNDLFNSEFDDDEEEGIKITFRHDDIDLDSDDDDYDDVFIPSQGSRKQSGSIIYFMTKSDLQTNSDLTQIGDFTNELPFYQCHSVEDIYPSYKTSTSGSVSLEEKIIPNIINKTQNKVLANNRESFASTYISSDDLTEFRDPSTSSVFIIEQDTVQLSPSHPKKTPMFFSPSNTAKRKISWELPKSSPLKKVTNFILKNSSSATATSNNSPSTQSTGCK